jgi:hypothetical protein
MTDYQKRVPSPAHMIADGTYVGGWFESFDGEINPAAASPRAGRLSSWLHVTFNTPTHFVGAHVADMGVAGHTAVLVVEKGKKQAHDRSKKSLLWMKKMRIDADFSRFEDLRSGSFISMTPSGGVELDVCTAGLSLKAQAEPAFSSPFVQTTVAPGGKGSLQWWGNLRLVSGVATLDGQRIELPPGALGAYDRTIGHRPSLQNWNWLSTSGEARCLESGNRVPFSMQMSKDGPRANPPVEARKTTLWVGDTMRKLPPITFSYDRLDTENNTTPWSVTSESGDDSGLDITFTPRFKRRELGAIPLVYQADFNQYYGVINGQFWTPQGRYQVEDVFALTEDSYLRF